MNNQNILKANFEARIKIAKEEGIRQGRREGIMDSKMNEYITKYKQEIENQADMIVDLEEAKERLTNECRRMQGEVDKMSHQIVAERNLQKTLSKEVEQLTMEVKALKVSHEDD